MKFDFDSVPNIITFKNYNSLLRGELNHYFDNEFPIVLFDTLGGFDSKFNNDIINYLKINNVSKPIITEYVIGDEIRDSVYPLDIKMSTELKNNADLKYNHGYNTHPPVNYKNFLCSFNNTLTHGRELLTASLEKFGLFNQEYCSKYFKSDEFYMIKISNDMGIQLDINKFFFTSNYDFLSNTFIFADEGWDFEKERSEPYGVAAMRSNMYKLENKITQSFVNLVSETISHTYYPFITEKFLASIVTRGLFITYGQPHWHSHVEKYYGFKKYNKIFDYSFDEITNPMERVISLLSMLYKFSLLSKDDWNDLYLMEQDTIEFNYDHYFSNGYLKSLEKYE